MKHTQIRLNFIIIFLIYLSFDFTTTSSSPLDSQPALIPTYDTSGVASEKLALEPLKVNSYSESLESITTTTPLNISKHDRSLEYSSSTETNNGYSASNKPDSGLEADYRDQPSSKFESETKIEENLKPQAYINSIVNPEPYSKLLEFNDKPKEKPDVRVTIYHHQGISDPVSNYGSGKPWNFYGTGYGIHYEHNKDGSYGREKGYQFEKAHGRDFCDKKECQLKEREKVAASSKVEKSPIESHVEGLLKHNNVDIQNWYREGSHKPETVRPPLSMSKPAHFAPRPLLDPAYPETASVPSKSEIGQTPVWSEKPTPTLHKISSFIPNRDQTFSTFTPQTETNFYSNFKPKPKVYIKPYLYPKDNHFAYSETIETNRPEMNAKPKHLETAFLSVNRYNTPYSPKYLSQPHTHVHSDFHSNNNNFRNIDPKQPVYKRKVHQTVAPYVQPTNDLFNFDQSFWPNSVTKPAPKREPYGDTQIYGGSTYMPKYMPQDKAFFPTSGPAFYRTNTLDPFSWNPYS